MSIHKFNPDRAPAEPRTIAVGLTFQHELYDLGDAIIKTRAIQAFEAAATRYPIHRLVRCAAHRKLEVVFDDLALNIGLAAHRLDTGSLLLDGPGAFIHAEGRRKAEYCSCTFNLWTDSRERAEELRATIMRVVGDHRVREQMFVIDWQFMARGGLTSVPFDEIASDELHDEAYPTLGASVREFVRAYLDSSAIVLILQGPPGTGKTRLVRAILAEMSRRKGDSAEVMFTADKSALQNDEIYVEFITGSHDAFVIEDADHLLMARTDGNQDIHRFLSIADGVVRAQGRKIIFTTNIPNVRDVDEALLRPGRCHGVVRTRLLDREEAEKLLVRLSAGDDGMHRAAIARLTQVCAQTFSIADVYRAMSV